MLVEKVIGNINDDKFKNSKIDYVDIEWHEAFKKLHRKTSQNGIEVGIKLDNDILTKGLRQGDVLAINDESIIAVNIPKDKAWVVKVDDNKAMEYFNKLILSETEIENLKITGHTYQEIVYKNYQAMDLDKQEELDNTSKLFKKKREKLEQELKDLQATADKHFKYYLDECNNLYDLHTSSIKEEDKNNG